MFDLSPKEKPLTELDIKKYPVFISVRGMNFSKEGKFMGKIVDWDVSEIVNAKTQEVIGYHTIRKHAILNRAGKEIGVLDDKYQIRNLEDKVVGKLDDKNFKSLKNINGEIVAVRQSAKYFTVKREDKSF